MKRTITAFFLFMSIGLSSPLFGNITPYPGLTLLYASTYIGHLSSQQTLSLDLVTAQAADIEMRVVNDDTNEVVAIIAKTGLFDSGPANGGANGAPIIMTIESSGGQDIVNMTNFTEGFYHVEMDMQCYDYWASYRNTRSEPSSYFDGNSGYGALYIDVGANESDVWAWGGAGLIVYNNE